MKVRRVAPALLLALGLIVIALVPSGLFADAGILIPTDRPEPDPDTLSLEEMRIDIHVDNGIARVGIRQIFANHTSRTLEAQWVFALPAGAAVSDFAVWDGVVRIPGVILERRRAQEIYESLTRQSIDPGLLQQGEYGPEEARRNSIFSARVSPIPGYGYKRVEVEYHQRLPVEDLRSYFAVPLRPDAYRAQTARSLQVNLDFRSEHPIQDFEIVGDTYDLNLIQQTPHRVEASFRGSNIQFNEDLAIEYSLAGDEDKLEILTFRDPSQSAPHPESTTIESSEPVLGFFEASALLAAGDNAAASMGPPAPRQQARSRTLIALFDNSLSMQWEKLDRGFRALERVLHRMTPTGRFHLLLFNTDVDAFAEEATPAIPSNIEKALDFVRASRLRGGTNIRAALHRALSLLPAEGGGEAFIVLIGDGGATQGTIHNGRLAEWYQSELEALPPSQRPRTYVFGVGDDANLPLLDMLAGPRGVVETVRSTEPIDFSLEAFVSKIGRDPMEGLGLTVEPDGYVDLVYPLERNRFSGSVASWVGLYTRPMAGARFRVEGSRGADPIRLEAQIDLPERATVHAHLPRTWARARVDALLEKIEREGEDSGSINEIIRLAKKYKFVTPYTSFLAAPRSLLRPRVIRPGDPVLRVRTDESIVSVTALFPFGLTKRMKYLEADDTWQTRFLAPKDMADGSHDVRLVLRDKQGRVYREKKTFTIVSKPPIVRTRLEKRQFQRGEVVRLKASASKFTRTLVARMYGTPTVSLHWDPQEGYNTGQLMIPADLPAGAYAIRLIAEDFAHNIGTEEVTIEVLP